MAGDDLGVNTLGMDPDVARLLREQRLLEAARLASERGDARTASTIFERACEWTRAALEAIRAGDAARALRLAAHAGDHATCEEAAALLARDAPSAKNAAAGLSALGQHGWAARTLERSGEPIDAAREWELAGDAQRAAALLEGAGEVADAERVLQAALRRDPDAFPVAVALGALLARLANWPASVRVLQRVPPGAKERPEALLHLRRALAKLGFSHAARCSAIELAALQRSDEEGNGDGPPPNPASPHGSLLFGRYDFVREVASSPHARVLECRDVLRGQRVAVKMFVGTRASPSGRDALGRFEHEVRAIKALEHPNIVPIVDVVVEPPAIVMAWMPGGALERMLAGPAPIAPARAVEIASAALSALSAAHRAGILHLALKPSNILLDGAGGARVGDFGTAPLSDVSTTANAGTFAGFVYMSPEQREGRPASVRSDLFSVGVVLREMLTGEVPAPDDTAPRLPSRVHPDLDARHDAVVERMTARDPQQRPADANEAREILAALSWHATTSSSSKRPRFEPPRAAGTDERLESLADGVLLDRWTGRKVERLQLTNQAHARARAFALADHEGLQTVWRVDDAGCGIWLEPLDARPPDRPLTNQERARLENALDALHAAGGVHGSVDANHVLVGPSGVVLRLEVELDAEASPGRDRLALARL